MSVRAIKARAHRLRTQGYADGYTLRPARSPEVTYQRAWRQGRKDRLSEAGAA